MEYSDVLQNSWEGIKMEGKLTKKYGLITAIAMVVGIVIGSGIFFKAQDILRYTNGNMLSGIAAWLIGGAVMIICAYTFSTMATKYEKVNGLVDYAETTCGSRYAYMVGWFIATIYYPAMTSVLCWVSARFTCVLSGVENPVSGVECFVLAGFYMVASFFINAISPRIAGRFQVTATVIKLVPPILMAIVGTAVGLFRGTLVDSFSPAATASAASGSPSLMSAIVAAAFAYEGWIIATSINAEIKNSKRNLPIALTVGALIVVAVYNLYFIGLAGGAPVETLIEEGAFPAFIGIFGEMGGAALNFFIVISCLGTLNGLMLACTRGIYAIAARDEGIRPDMFSEVSKTTGMPSNSAVAGLMLCAVWLFIWYSGTVRSAIDGNAPLIGIFAFDSSELPIITIYAMYIPIFIAIVKKEKDFGFFKRFVMPVLSLISCIFMMYAAYVAHKAELINYLTVFAVTMLAGWLVFITTSKKADRN